MEKQNLEELIKMFCYTVTGDFHINDSDRKLVISALITYQRVIETGIYINIGRHDTEPYLVADMNTVQGFPQEKL